jgi:DNA topoisomerase-3
VQLIVAEKPSVARDLARVLGVRPTGKHSFEGPDRVITWCVGHLVQLDEPAAYDSRWKAWRLDTLPMLPSPLRLCPADHAADQLKAVVALLQDARFAQVVNACDAGREGELIFRYVYQFARSRIPAMRLWISSLTDEAIRRGFQGLQPGARFDALGDAARSRSEADWLVGMNATRAVTVRGRTAEAGRDSPLASIGRVQTPTLAMLVARERQIRVFVPRDYWEVRAELRTEVGAKLTASWRYGKVARLAALDLAETICARDAAHAAAGGDRAVCVESVRARTVKEPPPLLFDLTALQRTANRRYGLSAARTLEVAQALYERHKVLTYPRTDSRHLTADMVAELPALIASLGSVPQYAAFATHLAGQTLKPGKRVVDDSKVHDHHAIIPTGNRVELERLDRDEARLFDLVARRFLGAFYPDAEIAVTEAWIRAGVAAGKPPATSGDSKKGDDKEPPMLDKLPPEPDRYLARGRVRLVPGWQAVAGSDGGDDDGSKKDRDSGELPPLAVGQVLAGTFAPLAKKTTPPARYTEATLLGAMESAGKTIDDEALRAAMKERGLGTPATRAAIIETLLRRKYIERAKTALVPTDAGIALVGQVEALPVASLASPELTGAWEARLAQIARGEDTRAAFMADIERYVRELVDAIRGTRSTPAPAASSTPAVLGTTTGLRCPRCKQGAVISGARAWGCSRWRDGCAFVTPFTAARTAAKLAKLVVATGNAADRPPRKPSTKR